MTTENSDAASYSLTCPSKCKCVRFPQQPGIFVMCTLYSLFEITFKYLKSPEIRWLHINCKLPRSLFYGKLQDEEFSGMQNLEELSISGCTISHVPSRAFAGLNKLQNLVVIGAGVYGGTYPAFAPGWTQPLSSLRTLDLNSNNLDGFPPEAFCCLTYLEKLVLSNNRLSNSGLGINCNKAGELNSTCQPCLPGVIHLDISHNVIRLLDINFSQDLPRLKYINASHCSLSVLSPDSQIPAGIEVLDLSNNILSDITADQFSNASHLYRLSLQNNRLKSLPQHFFRMIKNLTYLDMSGNLLTETTLHVAILEELTQLVWLDLSDNHVRKIQAPMLQGMVNLVELSSSNCSLERIENTAFLSLISLRKLKLDNNKLHVLDSDLFKSLGQLTSLDLSGNNLTNFEVTKPLQSLTELYLGANMLQSVPDFPEPWTSLIVLDMRENSITQIEGHKMSGLGNLRGIRISFNKITSISGYAFASLKMLNVLNLENNLISFIDYSAFYGLTNLMHLKLQRNMIPSLSTYLTPLTSLQRLYIAANRVQSIEQMNLPSTLEFIDLSFNLIGKIEIKAFRNLDRLLALNLTYNALTTLSKGSLMMSQKVWLRPQLFLIGNSLHCNCNMGWLRKINTDR